MNFFVGVFALILPALGVEVASVLPIQTGQLIDGKGSDPILTELGNSTFGLSFVDDDVKLPGVPILSEPSFTRKYYSYLMAGLSGTRVAFATSVPIRGIAAASDNSVIFQPPATGSLLLFRVVYVNVTEKDRTADVTGDVRTVTYDPSGWCVFTYDPALTPSVTCNVVPSGFGQVRPFSIATDKYGAGVVINAYYYSETRCRSNLAAAANRLLDAGVGILQLRAGGSSSATGFEVHGEQCLYVLNVTASADDVKNGEGSAPTQLPPSVSPSAPPVALPAALTEQSPQSPLDRDYSVQHLPSAPSAPFVGVPRSASDGARRVAEVLKSKRSKKSKSSKSSKSPSSKYKKKKISISFGSFSNDHDDYHPVSRYNPPYSRSYYSPPTSYDWPEAAPVAPPSWWPTAPSLPPVGGSGTSSSTLNNENLFNGAIGSALNADPPLDVESDDGETRPTVWSRFGRASVTTESVLWQFYYDFERSAPMVVVVLRATYVSQSATPRIVGPKDITVLMSSTPAVSGGRPGDQYAAPTAARITLAHFPSDLESYPIIHPTIQEVHSSWLTPALRGTSVRIKTTTIPGTVFSTSSSFGSDIPVNPLSTQLDLNREVGFSNTYCGRNINFEDYLQFDVKTKTMSTLCAMELDGVPSVFLASMRTLPRVLAAASGPNTPWASFAQPRRSAENLTASMGGQWEASSGGDMEHLDNRFTRRDSKTMYATVAVEFDADWEAADCVVYGTGFRTASTNSHSSRVGLEDESPEPSSTLTKPMFGYRDGAVGLDFGVTLLRPVRAAGAESPTWFGFCSGVQWGGWPIQSAPGAVIPTRSSEGSSVQVVNSEGLCAVQRARDGTTYIRYVVPAPNRTSAALIENVTVLGGGQGPQFFLRDGTDLEVLRSLTRLSNLTVLGAEPDGGAFWSLARGDSAGTIPGGLLLGSANEDARVLALKAAGSQEFGGVGLGTGGYLHGTHYAAGGSGGASCLVFWVLVCGICLSIAACITACVKACCGGKTKVKYQHRDMAYDDGGAYGNRGVGGGAGGGAAQYGGGEGGMTTMPAPPSHAPMGGAGYGGGYPAVGGAGGYPGAGAPVGAAGPYAGGGGYPSPDGPMGGGGYGGAVGYAGAGGYSGGGAPVGGMPPGAGVTPSGGYASVPPGGEGSPVKDAAPMPSP